MSEREDLASAVEDTRSAYVTGRDLKVVGIAIVVFAIIATPLYLSCKQQSDKHLCKQNMRGISNAINLYAASNNDLYPPLYAPAADGLPLVDGKNRPFTWVSLVSEYLGERVSFMCPSATEEENTIHQHRTDSDKQIVCSYGLYVSRATTSTFALRSPSQAVLVSETSNRGAGSTFDPLPFGNGIADGFVIGFNDSNSKHSLDTKHVTRLAFPGTANGNFRSDGKSRHEGGNFFLFVDGHASPLPPTAAIVDVVGNQIDGYWATR